MGREGKSGRAMFLLSSQNFLLMMPIQPILIYSFNTVFQQNSNFLVVDHDKLVIKFFGNCKKPRQSKETWKRTKLEHSHFLISKRYKTAVMKTVCYWHRDKQSNQWNSIESHEIKLHLQSMTFNRVLKQFNGRKNEALNR